MTDKNKEIRIDPDSIFVSGKFDVREDVAPTCDCGCFKITGLFGQLIPQAIAFKEIPREKMCSSKIIFSSSAFCPCGECHTFKTSITPDSIEFERHEAELLDDSERIRRIKGL